MTCCLDRLVRCVKPLFGERVWHGGVREEVWDEGLVREAEAFVFGGKKSPLPALPRKRGRGFERSAGRDYLWRRGQREFLDLRRAAFCIDGTENGEAESSADTPASGRVYSRRVAEAKVVRTRRRVWREAFMGSTGPCLMGVCWRWPGFPLFAE